LGWSDVISRRPVVLPIGSIEVFLDDLLPARKSVASAHTGIMTDTPNRLAFPSKFEGLAGAVPLLREAFVKEHNC